MSLTNENVVNLYELGFDNAVKEIKSRLKEKLTNRTVNFSVTSLKARTPGTCIGQTNYVRGQCNIPTKSMEQNL